MLKSLLCAMLLLAGGSAWAAQVVGVVAHLSGPLLDRKLDGSVKVLGLKSEVENGDTLVSEKNTYAQIRFVDNSEITLKPGTTFRIENFSYDAGKPDADSAAFNLVKGGLRSITGLLGKRNKEKFSLKTPSATIGIRGTTFVAEYVPKPAPTGMRIEYDVSALDAQGGQKAPTAGATQGKVGIDRSPNGSGISPGRPQTGKQPAGSGGLSSAQEQALINAMNSRMEAAMQQAAMQQAAMQQAAMQQAAMQQAAMQQAAAQVAPATQLQGLQGLAPGLHVSVTEGAIVVTNNGGAQGFAAGQFGYVPGANQPPVVVPPNTGLQFVPPPSFSGSGTGPQAPAGSSTDKPAVDCIVR